MYGSLIEIVDETDPVEIDENYALIWGSFGSIVLPDTEPDPEEPIFVQGQIFGDVQREYGILFENEVPNCSNFGSFGCLADPPMIVDSLEQTDLSDAEDEIFEIRASLSYRFTRAASTSLSLNYSHFNRAFGNVDTAGQRFRYTSKDPAAFSVWALTPGVSMAPFELPEPEHGGAVAVVALAWIVARRRT